PLIRRADPGACATAPSPRSFAEAELIARLDRRSAKPTVFLFIAIFLFIAYHTIFAADPSGRDPHPMKTQRRD
ncbi:MAG: hypothetical protein WBX15_02720, partial [Thermoanaerobaculia bacterium]